MLQFWRAPLDTFHFRNLRLKLKDVRGPLYSLLNGTFAERRFGSEGTLLWAFAFLESPRLGYLVWDLPPNAPLGGIEKWMTLALPFVPTSGRLLAGYGE